MAVYETFGVNTGSNYGDPTQVVVGTLDLIGAQTTLAVLGSIFVVGSTITPDMSADLAAISAALGSTSQDVMLAVNTGNVTQKMDVRTGMESITNYLWSGPELGNTVPPGG
jgi:hypothetical protein